MDNSEVKNHSQIKVEENKSEENQAITPDHIDLDTNDLKATRKDLQIPRRMFHMAGGSFVATVYALLLQHQQAVYILGTCACLIYIFEQIRISYPEQAKKFSLVTQYLYRAEEQLRESAGVPMVMGLLLTILSFPKIIAVTAIFTLAIADPLSAMIGIRYGQTHIVKDKSVEGSLAFFCASFILTLVCFAIFNNTLNSSTWLLAFLGAFGISIFEMIPLRLDDNLTIPLVTAFWLWLLCAVIGIPI